MALWNGASSPLPHCLPPPHPTPGAYRGQGPPFSCCAPPRGPAVPSMPRHCTALTLRPLSHPGTWPLPSQTGGRWQCRIPRIPRTCASASVRRDPHPSGTAPRDPARLLSIRPLLPAHGGLRTGLPGRCPQSRCFLPGTRARLKPCPSPPLGMTHRPSPARNMRASPPHPLPLTALGSPLLQGVQLHSGPAAPSLPSLHRAPAGEGSTSPDVAAARAGGLVRAGSRLLGQCPLRRRDLHRASVPALLLSPAASPPSPPCPITTPYVSSLSNAPAPCPGGGSHGSPCSPRHPCLPHVRFPSNWLRCPVYLAAPQAAAAGLTDPRLPSAGLAMAPQQLGWRGRTLPHSLQPCPHPWMRTWSLNCPKRA